MSELPRKKLSGKKKSFFLVLALMSLFWLRVGYYAVTQEPLRVSKETTYLTGPIREDGTVDYAAALNERNKVGVTSENNAAVVLAKVLGPSVGGEEYFKELGISIPLLDGDYYLPISQFHVETFIPQTEADWDLMPEFDLDDQYGFSEARPWTAEEFPDLARFFEANRIPLDHLLAVVEKPKYYNPVVQSTNWFSVGLSNKGVSAHLRNLSADLCVKGMLAIGEKDFSQAHDCLNAIHRLALCQVEESGTISYLCYRGETDRVFRLMNELISSGENKPEQLRHFQNILDEHERQHGVAEHINFGARIEALEEMNELIYRLYISGENREVSSIRVAINGAKSLYRLDWNILYSRLNEGYDAVVENFRSVDPSMGFPVDNTSYDERTSAFNEMLSRCDIEYLQLDVSLSREEFSERSGFYLFDVLGVSNGYTLARSEVRGAVGLKVNQLGLRLEEHVIDNGSYPELLTDLEPPPTAEEMFDPFADKDLTYKKNGRGYVLYSWGDNQFDQEGQSYGEIPPGDDITFRIVRAITEPTKAERP
ncbi:hypothetical protein Pla110_37200 [Polystyrenella longa]|uniref:Bacterial type II secretion system protein G n=1 Tax=Polystyrenella longa TaxID=2528007 RepID=A0A518CRX6_9PLAN|nr:hypothetical protein [Polystyrenella longa]QDU81968.1 hypothetical protein Pla110_37200 [Polystyrenella longa]